MPIYSPTERGTGANGFTLVEMLVVVFLIGLASAAVVMALPASASSARSQGEHLAARIAAARDDAVLQARPIAVWFRPSGYGFERYSKGTWLPINDRTFENRRFDDGTRIASVDIDRIIFDATGLPSGSANIRLTNGGDDSLVAVAATGEVKVAQ